MSSPGTRVSTTIWNFLKGAVLSALEKSEIRGMIDAAEDGTSISDHGELDGLGDDDHPQYLTAVRADARYDYIGLAATARAEAIQRANHTGTQATSTVVGLDDEIGKAQVSRNLHLIGH